MCGGVVRPPCCPTHLPFLPPTHPPAYTRPHAQVYANGEAERIMGQAIKELGWPRSEFAVSTKVGGRVDTGRRRARRVGNHTPSLCGRKTVLKNTARVATNQHGQALCLWAL